MYRLKDEDDARLLEQLSEPEDIASLRNEIAMARLIVQKAADIGHHGTAISGLNLLAKLSQSFDAHTIRTHNHLSRNAVVTFAKKAAELLADSTDRLPIGQIEKDQFMDEFVASLLIALDDTLNSQRKVNSPLRLTEEKQ